MINVRIQHHNEVQKLSPKITVVGVGGAGGNAVNNMIGAGLHGCEFIVCNTDAQAIEGSLCENRLQLGVTVTGGLGAGARPEIGRAAAEESLDEVMGYLDGSNMVFVTAGMGGGTGTGAAPVIAKACREKGILTVGVVTKPFHFEGTLRMKMAEQGIEEMQQYVDTLIVIPNQNLFRVANEKTTFAEAFRMADSVLQSAVRGVTDLMVVPGEVNLDFADIRSVMQEMGKAMMGTGEATGERRAIEAAEKAINNPLLDDVSMKGARAVIINVTGGSDMTLFEIDEACNRIREEVDPSANIIFGSSYDASMEGVLRVSVIATGIDVAEQRARGGRNAFGPHIINAVTAQQSERRMERAQPNTSDAVVVSAASGPQPAGAAVARAAATTVAAPVGPLRVPQAAVGMQTGNAYAMPSAARRTDNPDGDLFEQREYATGTGDSLAKKYETAPQAALQSDVGVPVSSYAGFHAAQQQGVMPPQAPTSGPMRGAVYNNAFIPPAPIEVEQNPRATGYGPHFGHLSAARAQVEDRPAAYAPQQQMPASPGLTLRPPVPGANSVPKKRTKSFFERFTEPLRPHQHDTAESYSTDAGQYTAPAPRAQRGPVLQGSLNIDAPSAAQPGAHDDELDIPAFLRRQAN